MDVFECSQDKHPEVWVRYSGVWCCSQHCFVQVWNLLDERFRVLEERWWLRFLWDLPTAASEPCADAACYDDAARDDQAAAAACDDDAACYNKTSSSGDDDAAGNHKTAFDPRSDHHAPSHYPSSSSYPYPAPRNGPGLPILWLDKRPGQQRRHLVEARCRGLGALWSDRPKRQIPGSEVHPLCFGRLRACGDCGTLCDERVCWGGMGKRV